MNQPASVKSGFQVRFVEDETPPVHDILFTDVSGVVRQSLDVYGDAEGAEIAIVELEASGKLPYGWDECPELFGVYNQPSEKQAGEISAQECANG